MTLKADGERYLLFVTESRRVFLINRSTDIFYFKLPVGLRFHFSDRVRGPLLLDGELVEHSPGKFEYLAFDILFYPSPVQYVEGELVRGQTMSCMFQNFNIRQSILNEVLASMGSKYMVCSSNQWFPITDIIKVSIIYKFVEETTNKIRKKQKLIKLKSDGIILQPNDTAYVPFREWNKYNNVQFKWKPSDQLTIDFQIKMITKSQWVLLSSTGQQFMVQQPKGKDPVPAMCYPTESQQEKYHDSEVVEFKYQEKDNPEHNLFVPMRSRNEKRANGYKTIMSTLYSIQNPFKLESVKEPLEVITSESIKTKKGIKNVLNTVFTKSDLILFSLYSSGDSFFNESEIKTIKSLYKKYSKTEQELEVRIFTNTKKNKSMDKSTFYYLLDFLWDSYPHTYSENYDVSLNEYGTKKYRSTYSSIENIKQRKTIENIVKETIQSVQGEESKEKLYSDLVYKVALSVEKPSNKIITLKNKSTNNLIRYKRRFSFYFTDLWRLDLTRVKSSYEILDLFEKNDTFEFECEYVGSPDISDSEFMDSFNKMYMTILSNSSYC